MNCWACAPGLARHDAAATAAAINFVFMRILLPLLFRREVGRGAACGQPIQMAHARPNTHCSAPACRMAEPLRSGAPLPSTRRPQSGCRSLRVLPTPLMPLTSQRSLDWRRTRNCGQVDKRPQALTHLDCEATLRVWPHSRSGKAITARNDRIRCDTAVTLRFLAVDVTILFSIAPLTLPKHSCARPENSIFAAVTAM